LTPGGDDVGVLVPLTLHLLAPRPRIDRRLIGHHVHVLGVVPLTLQLAQVVLLVASGVVECSDFLFGLD